MFSYLVKICAIICFLSEIIAQDKDSVTRNCMQLLRRKGSQISWEQWRQCPAGMTPDPPCHDRKIYDADIASHCIICKHKSFKAEGNSAYSCTPCDAFSCRPNYKVLKNCTKPNPDICSLECKDSFYKNTIEDCVPCCKSDKENIVKKLTCMLEKNCRTVLKNCPRKPANGSFHFVKVTPLTTERKLSLATTQAGFTALQIIIIISSVLLDIVAILVTFFIRRHYMEYTTGGREDLRKMYEINTNGGRDDLEEMYEINANGSSTRDMSADEARVQLPPTVTSERTGSSAGDMSADEARVQLPPTVTSERTGSSAGDMSADEARVQLPPTVTSERTEYASKENILKTSIACCFCTTNNLLVPTGEEPKDLLLKEGEATLVWIVDENLNSADCRKLFSPFVKVGQSNHSDKAADHIMRLLQTHPQMTFGNFFFLLESVGMNNVILEIHNVFHKNYPKVETPEEL